MHPYFGGPNRSPKARSRLLLDLKLGLHLDLGIGVLRMAINDLDLATHNADVAIFNVDRRFLVRDGSDDLMTIHIDLMSTDGISIDLDDLVSYHRIFRLEDLDVNLISLSSRA